METESSPPSGDHCEKHGYHAWPGAGRCPRCLEEEEDAASPYVVFTLNSSKQGPLHWKEQLQMPTRGEAQVAAASFLPGANVLGVVVVNAAKLRRARKQQNWGPSQFNIPPLPVPEE